MLTLTLTLALKLMPFVNGGRRSGWCHSLSTGDFDLKRPTNCIKYQGKCSNNGPHLSHLLQSTFLSRLGGHGITVHSQCISGISVANGTGFQCSLAPDSAMIIQLQWDSYDGSCTG